MYIFEAHYIDMDNDEEIIVEIKFDGQFMENDKECYMYAMNRAYDLKKENECLVTLEFIAC